MPNYSAAGERGSTPAQRIELAFRQVIAAVVLHNEQAAYQAGMSLAESQFVHLLALHGPMTPSQLSRHSRLPSGTVTGVLDRLEQLDFVHRERHASDRRKVVVVLHDDQVAERLSPHFADEAALLRTVIARFTNDQQATIADFLDALLTYERTGSPGER